jgi:glucosylglycerate phosphorylase
MNGPFSKIHALLTAIYGHPAGGATFERLVRLIEDHQPLLPPARAFAFDSSDALLITYGDMVQEAGQSPLVSLGEFLDQYVRDSLSGIHLLPFYPYSSDDGYSVIDYKSVDSKLGDWDDIAQLAYHYRLMFDAVINHISAESEWFQGFVAGDPRYRDYFITVEPGTDLSGVFRPRALPLLTPVDTFEGQKLVWTTFSDDQIDLNFKDPQVLLDIIDVILFYIERGAEYIRLDAVGYLWKEIGTSSLHLPEAHQIIRLFRAILDQTAPHVMLVTETNVPHQDNVAYFGDGLNEAQMVYNFSLPPLVLHTIGRGNAGALSDWAKSLDTPSLRASFLNFTASHDGIGLTPAYGLISRADIENLAERTRALGGHVSFRQNADGSKSPYELNINYLDALADPEFPEEQPRALARRFLLSQEIMLALRGVPGIYFHSLFGSRGWPEGVTRTGHYRTINRQKLERQKIEKELADPDSLRSLVFYPYLNLIKLRQTEPGAAFSPVGMQEVLELDERVFALRRGSEDGKQEILCLHNVSGQALQIPLDVRVTAIARESALIDLIGKETYKFKFNAGGIIPLEPYQSVWLARSNPLT